MADFEPWFVTFFNAGILFVFIFYFVVPLCMTVRAMYKRESILAGWRGYREWLLALTHIFFSGVALMLTVFIAMAAIQYVTTARELNSLSLSMAANGQPAASTDRVLSLAEVMFGFFGLVLSLITVVSAIFAWWLRKTVEMTAEDTKILRKQVQEDAETYRNDLSGNLSFAKSSVVIAADIALAQIPDVTFSQQIPAGLIGAFRVLEKIWLNEKYWEEIVNSENGVRIRYARALYLIGTSTDWVSAVGDASSVSSKSRTDVVSLLTDALERADDLTLQKNIRIRLFQAYRQASMLDKAQAELREIRELKDELVFLWGMIVLNLQKGLKERDDLGARRAFFEEAVQNADKLYNRLKAFPSRETAAIQYYCAKAYWSFRFSWGNDLEGSPLSVDKWRRSAERFHEMALEASRQLDSALSSGITDDLTKAIYLVSKAYLLVAWTAYPDSLDPDPPVATSPQQDPSRLLREARDLLQGKKGGPVYNDHLERLGSIEEFQDYRAEVERFAGESEKLWDFYQLKR